MTALPRDASINICSASGVLLDALVDGSHKSFGPDPKALAKSRQAGCFPSLPAYQQEFGGSSSPDWAKVQNRVKETSNYFRLTSIVTIGSAEFTLYSLLERDGQNQVHVLMRSFTPD